MLWMVCYGMIWVVWCGYGNGMVWMVWYYIYGNIYRTYLFQAKPKLGHLKKYCYPKLPVAMQLEDIRRCGRQILEALKTLQDKGFPYGILKNLEKNKVLHF